jgi:anti-sigma factor RsiW
MKTHRKNKTEPRSTRCQDLLRLFADYLDGDLPDAVCAELESHLRKCQTCDCVVESLKKTIAMYRKMPEVPLPATIDQQLKQFLRRRFALKAARKIQ